MLATVLQASGKQFWGSPSECLFLPLNAKHVEFPSLLFAEGLAVSDLCDRDEGKNMFICSNEKQTKSRVHFHQRLSKRRGQKALNASVVHFFSGHISHAKLKSTQTGLRVYNRLVEVIKENERQTVCSVWHCRGVNNGATLEGPFRFVTHSYARNLLKHTVLALTVSIIKITGGHLLLLTERRYPLCDTTRTSFMEFVYMGPPALACTEKSSSI